MAGTVVTEPFNHVHPVHKLFSRTCSNMYYKLKTDTVHAVVYHVHHICELYFWYVFQYIHHVHGGTVMTVLT